MYTTKRVIASYMLLVLIGTHALEVDLLRSVPQNDDFELLERYTPRMEDIVGPDGSMTDLKVQSD
jgi:hypothetical protein